MSELAPKLAWVGCCALAMKDGIIPASSAPGGVYERKVGEWRIFLNGSPDDKPKTDKHPALPKFAVYVEYNGWPAGIIDPGSGIIAAGEAANEDSFIAAIEADLGCGIEAALASQ